MHHASKDILPATLYKPFRRNSMKNQFIETCLYLISPENSEDQMSIACQANETCQLAKGMFWTTLSIILSILAAHIFS